MTHPTCATCRYWEGRGTYGLCRINPPRFLIANGEQHEMGDWPQSRGDDWCGQHRHKGEPTPPLTMGEYEQPNWSEPSDRIE